jgi:hypothetical protein
MQTCESFSLSFIQIQYNILIVIVIVIVVITLIIITNDYYDAPLTCSRSLIVLNLIARLLLVDLNDAV